MIVMGCNNASQFHLSGILKFWQFQFLVFQYFPVIKTFIKIYNIHNRTNNNKKPTVTYILSTLT